MRLTRLVASTKFSERNFWNRSLLGRSLLHFPDAFRPELHIRFENEGKWGLPEIYNQAIDDCPADRHLLFVHDDVFLHDVFLQHRVDESLDRFDVVGLAGSKDGDLSQPSWGLAFDAHLRPTGWQTANSQQPTANSPGSESGSPPNRELSAVRCQLRAGTEDRALASTNPPPAAMILSGAVSHVSRYVDPGVQRSLAPAPALGVYGPCPAECDLLDGLFLACRRDALGYSQEASDLGLPPSGSGSGSEPTPKTQHPTPSLVRFDERFRFHLYDLDFCRAASRAGLRLGTWPILVSHGSGGNFDTEEFRATARLYLDKWEARFVAEREVKAESKKQKAPDPDPDPNGFQLSAFSFRPPAARAESTSASTGTLAVELAP